MKKIIPILLLSIMANACTQAPSTDSKASVTYPTANVGVTVSNITNPFFKAAYDTYKKQADSEPNLTLALQEANNDQAVQYKQYDEMIAKGAKALIINLADVAQGGAVIEKYCNQVPLVFFNRNPGDKELAKCEKAYFVDGDAVQAGVLQGLKVLELWKANPAWDKNGDGKIQFAIVKGIPNHAGAEARTKWAIGTMENYPNLGIPVEQIYGDYAMFDKEKARLLVSSWTGQPQFANVEIVLSNNDAMALGVIEAVKSMGIKLPIFGIDATNEGLAAIKSGDMTATVLNDATEQAKVSLRLAANLAANEPLLSGIDYKMEHKTIKVPYQEVE